MGEAQKNVVAYSVQLPSLDSLAHISDCRGERKGH